MLKSRVLNHLLEDPEKLEKQEIGQVSWVEIINVNKNVHIESNLSGKCLGTFRKFR